MFDANVTRLQHRVVALACTAVTAAVLTTVLTSAALDASQAPTADRLVTTTGRGTDAPLPETGRRATSTANAFTAGGVETVAVRAVPALPLARVATVGTTALVAAVATVAGRWSWWAS